MELNVVMLERQAAVVGTLIPHYQHRFRGACIEWSVLPGSGLKRRNDSGLHVYGRSGVRRRKSNLVLINSVCKVRRVRSITDRWAV